MATALIHMPASAKAGDIIEIRALISHQMETGFRPGADGKAVPRDILRRFECQFNGKPLIAADLHPAMSANPYLSFHMKAMESGTLTFKWSGDNGFTQTEQKQLTVKP